MVTVNITKTRWRMNQAYQIIISPRPATVTCAVAAWDRYVKIQAPAPPGPAFILKGGVALDVPTLLGALCIALSHLGIPEAQSYTLYSLSRGGAQALAKAGGTLKEIMDLGSWSSSAVHVYIPRDMLRPQLKPSD